MLIRKSNRISVHESAEETKSQFYKDTLNKGLSDACRAGTLSTVKYVLKEGADPNTKDGMGYTPLYYASGMGHTDIVKLLLEVGADPNIKTKYGNTPLHLASENDYVDIVKLLLEAEADPNIKDDDGETPLHEATSGECAEVVKLLLEAGADPNIKDQWGNTPLHKASSRGQTEIVKLLLEADADPNIKGNNGETPLHFTSRWDRTELVKLLLGAGANPNIINNKGETPKDVARKSSIIALLEPYSFIGLDDINEENDDGDTPLALVIQRNNLKKAKELIRDGADINHISVRRAYMNRKYRNNETAQYVEDLVNNPKKKSKFDF